MTGELEAVEPRPGAAVRPGAGPAPAPAPARAVVGYAGIGDAGSELERQVRALSDAGCVRVYADQPGAGGTAGRPELAAGLAGLAPGDTLVVASLDQLAPSLPDLIGVVVELQRRGVGFRSLQEGLDPATPGGRLAGDLFVPLAEFIRDLLEEEDPAGTDAGRRRRAQPIADGVGDRRRRPLR